MDCSTPGFPVHHQLLELAQTHVRQVCDAVQPSHPLLSPSPPLFNLSHHQGLFFFFFFRRFSPSVSNSIKLVLYELYLCFCFCFCFCFYFILLYSTVLVLAYIDMNPPRVYMSSQT